MRPCGWAISDDNPFPFGSGAPLTLEHTTDGGATWIPQYVYQTTPSCTQSTSSSRRPAGQRATAALGEQRRLPDGAIFGSTNGGHTWTKEKLPEGAPDMTGLQFPSRHSGWAVGTSYDGNDDAVQAWVLHTTDGGKTWARLADLNDSLATRSTSAIPRTAGWAA